MPMEASKGHEAGSARAFWRARERLPAPRMRISRAKPGNARSATPFRTPHSWCQRIDRDGGNFQKIVLKTCMCSSRATFLFYLAVLASSILCAASTAFAPQKMNLGQGDIALATREVGGMSRDVVMSGVLTQSATATTATSSLKVASTNGENRRSNAPSAADDLAIEFASPLTGASQL